MFSRRTPAQDKKECFGRLIRGARKRQGLSQEKLAEKMNCSRRWISNIERGISNLNWADTIYLMSTLQLEPEKVVEEVVLVVPVPTDRK